MKRLYVPSFLAAVLITCSPDSLQEAISGCEITEGALPCFNLKSGCKVGYSEWQDPKATDGIKCQYCEDKE